MKNIKEFINQVNEYLDKYFPTIPNWLAWTAGITIIYLILK